MVRGPYLQWLRPNAITIVWATVDEVDSVVEYGPTAAYGSTASDCDWTAHHEVTLTGLSPSTVYHYRVRSGAQALSDDRTFKTAAGPGQTSFTFMVLGDTESGVDPKEFARYRRQADQGHSASSMMIRVNNPDFYLHTGDLTDNDRGASMAGWDDFFSFEGDLMSRITMFPTPGELDGNHYNYFRLFHLPNNERWYSFDYANAHFVSMQVDGYQDASPGSEQYRWVEDDLANTNKPWKFVFFHLPPYSCGPWGPQVQVQSLHSLFVRYGVDIVFTGHEHNYQRFPVDGVNYIITGGGGAEARKLTMCDPPYGERTKHVMKVTVTGNTLSCVAIRSDAEGSLLDPFTLTAN